MLVTTEAFDQACLQAGEFSNLLVTEWADSFTGTTGTALAAHTPDVGTGGYTDATAGLMLEGHKAAAPGGGGPLSVFDPGTVNFNATVTVVAKLADNSAELWCKYADATHLFMVQLFFSVNKVTLIENPGTGSVGRVNATFNYVDGATYVLNVVVTGNTWVINVNGVQVATYTGTSPLSANTKMALHLNGGSNGTAFSGLQVNNF